MKSGWEICELTRKRASICLRMLAGLTFFLCRFIILLNKKGATDRRLARIKVLVQNDRNLIQDWRSFLWFDLFIADAVTGNKAGQLEIYSTNVYMEERCILPKE